MASRESPITPTQVNVAIGAFATVALLLPIALVVQQARTVSVPGTALLLGGVIWAAAIAGSQWLLWREQRARRRALQREVRDVRNARLACNTTFRHRLIYQQAVLDRVLAIGDDVIEEGIIDPSLTLDNVRLIRAHAREAQDAIEDAIIEADVSIGSHEPDLVDIDARDEIEKVAAPFAQTGINIATSGPRHFVLTDPATYRVIMRGLINSAIARNADDIDVSVASDGDQIVCTVSDNGEPESATSISAMTRTLAATVDADPRFSRALGRNQFSIALPAGERPAGYTAPASPMDVLGDVPTSRRPATERRGDGLHMDPGALINFVSTKERDESQSVAAKRKSQLLAR